MTNEEGELVVILKETTLERLSSWKRASHALWRGRRVASAGCMMRSIWRGAC